MMTCLFMKCQRHKQNIRIFFHQGYKQNIIIFFFQFSSSPSPFFFFFFFFLLCSLICCSSTYTNLSFSFQTRIQIIHHHLHQVHTPSSQIRETTQNITQSQHPKVRKKKHTKKRISKPLPLATLVTSHHHHLHPSLSCSTTTIKSHCQKLPHCRTTTIVLHHCKVTPVLPHHLRAPPKATLPAFAMGHRCQKFNTKKNTWSVVVVVVLQG